ncbi:acyl-CoA-binding domain-containing protein 6 [Venturia canescens]|uniref:acyl-CoA-binding domain-containing protein 6 n=1 Tax=Venturia canescens TaxID=32260 RepID=UPI001C9D2299|nr:acyl-CoA-binding domain-containing protein 6 [Venturia canescens]
MDNSEMNETSELEETFSRASNHLQTLVAELDTGQLLGFYGLYKQATVGKCDTPRPNWYQTQAKHKWEAWKNLGEMSKETAMENYVRAVGKLDPTWEQNSKAGTRSWVAVSTMPNMDEELEDSDKTLLDWVKDGNEDKVFEALSINSSGLNDSDENGMMPIHWAADRGQVGTLKRLVEAGADLNAQDLNGQTALHYAASCAHVEVVQYLLSLGAKSLQDNDGLTPKDVASEGKALQLIVEMS